MVDGPPTCQCADYYEGDGLTCTPLCGDEVMVEGEVCDDGNALPGDGCRADCAGLEICGDGLLDQAAGEECDDANDTLNDVCEGCVIKMSDAWTCDPAVYKAEDGCDCGCGQVDADCPDETAESCDFCGGEGSCNPQDLSCQQNDPLSNAHCE